MPMRFNNEIYNRIAKAILKTMKEKQKLKISTKPQISPLLK